MRFSALCATSLLMVGIPSVPAAAQASACRPADSISADILNEIIGIATGTYPGSLQLRNDMKIPQVSASQVVYVTDKAVCSKVLPVYNANTRAIDSATGMEVDLPSGKLYIVKAGTVYVAWDPIKKVGEFRRYLTVDNKYKLLANSLR